MFGFESAVSQSGRWSKFCDGAGRRLLSLLWSLYVDDGQLCDLQAAREGQAVNRFFCGLGTPLAEAKRHKMVQCNVFLGMMHNVGAFHTKEVFNLQPIEQLIVKYRGTCVRSAPPTCAYQVNLPSIVGLNSV